MKWSLTLLPIVFLTACSGLPKKMRHEPYTRVSLKEAKTNLSNYQNKPLRWGGTLVSVTNKKTLSQAQILYYPINRYGRPNTSRKTEGRFAISQTQFLDPAIYKEGAEITVTGILSGNIKQKIGEKTLIVPMLKTSHIHIWPKHQQFDNRFQHYPYYHPSPYYYPPFPSYYRHNDYYYYNN
jgi:outer membrane lipoprotein